LTWNSCQSRIVIITGIKGIKPIIGVTIIPPIEIIEHPIHRPPGSPTVVPEVEIPNDPGRSKSRTRPPQPAELFIPKPEAEVIRNPAPGLLRNPENLSVELSPLSIIERLPISPGIIAVEKRPPDITIKTVPNPLSVES
jgi:hypothetical protein